MRLKAIYRISFNCKIFFVLTIRYLLKSLADLKHRYFCVAAGEEQLAKTIQMNHCTISKTGFYLSHQFFLFIFMMSMAGVGGALWWGYQLGTARFSQSEGILSGQWQHYLQVDRSQIKELEQQTEQQLSVISQHIGKIQANITRINTLGEHLIQVVKLDPTEFKLSEPFDLETTIAGNELNYLHTIKALGPRIEQQFAKMNAIHVALQTKLSEQELALTGLAKPVEGGRVSSYFGVRSDPFTGHRKMHKGVDIVSREGKQVKALAAGMVSFADRKGAYGRLVEIYHGNGLTTRYGHNKQLLVRSGQLVKKGEAIALLGSSGRTTGAHLHLEVRKDGKAVDPGLYFRDLSRH